MARSGSQLYITSAEVLNIIRLCRAQTDQIMLDYADKLESFARRQFPGVVIPKRQPVRRAPICHVHKLLKVYNGNEYVCPEPGCPWRTYEDEEPRGEGAKVYHQDVAEKARDAAHGSTKHGKKWDKPPRKWKQDEGSPNAKRIPLKEG